MRVHAGVCSLLLLPVAALAADPGRWFESPLSPRIANYRFEAELVPVKEGAKESPRVEAVEEITWNHPGSEPVLRVPFHLYLNAFRSADTPFLTRMGSTFRGPREIPEPRFGGCDVSKVERWLDGGWKDVTAAFRVEETLGFLDVRDAPVRAGETLRLRLSFTSRLPSVFARTGAEGTFHMVGQWYPQVGVYLPGEGWRARQFDAFGEFFADFGTFDAALTVPAGYEVAATGTREHEASAAGKKRVLAYHAEDVHDFVWAASPEFEVHEGTWRHVKLLVAAQKGRPAWSVQEHLDNMGKTLAWMDAHVGPYPYPVLTIVDPPRTAREADGMEYATLFTATVARKKGFLREIARITVVHELVHQYFQGMAASDEMNHAWMDEGMTSYYEARVYEDLFGGERGLPQTRVSILDTQRFSLAARGHRYPVDTPVEGFPSFDEYGINAYDRPALLMAQLERRLGTEAMDTMMRRYFAAWAFRHPEPADFARELDRERLDGTAWVRHFLRGPATLPVAVTAVDAREGGGATIRLRGVDGIRWPVEVVVGRRDGSVQRLVWDGGLEADALEVPAHAGGRVTGVELDPDDRLVLDPDRTDNVWGDPLGGKAWNARSRQRASFWAAVVSLWMGSA